MSKRLEVVRAVKALVASALPGWDVRGLDGDAARPAAIAPGGLAVVGPGEMGEPIVDLSPLRYNYDHAIPVELAFAPAAAQDGDGTVDAALGAIAAAVEGDRTLGGLVDFVDVTAPDVEDVAGPGTATASGALFTIVASYATASPLS